MKKRKIFSLILLAFCLFSAPAYAGPGATEEENAAIEADRARLTDNVLEFGEVGARVENYNATLVNLNATLKNSYLNYEAAEALGNDARELMEEARDLKDDDMDEETRLLYEEYRDMAQEARKAAMKLHDKELPSSAKRIIRQTKNTLQKTVENLIITYHTTAANAPAAEKNVELREALLSTQRNLMAAGLASQADVLAAEQAFYEAQASDAQLKAGLQNLRQNILMLTGYEAGADVQIGPAPAPDPGRIEAMNPEADAQTAIGTSFDLHSVKSAGVTSAGERINKRRTIFASEQSVTAQIHKMYGDVISARDAWTAAQSAYASAEAAKGAADRKMALGMSGRAEYLGAEIQFLSAKGSLDTAALALTKAMEDYDWAVNGGLIVKAQQ